MDSRKIVLRETGIIAIGECIGTLCMFLLFGLLGYWNKAVLFGGIAGALVATLNFFFLAVNVNIAADKATAQDVKGGKSLMQTSYIFRLVIIFAVLFACVKSGLCNAFATVIPLVFVRPTITIAEFFRKPGEH